MVHSRTLRYCLIHVNTSLEKEWLLLREHLGMITNAELLNTVYLSAILTVIVTKQLT